MLLKNILAVTLAGLAIANPVEDIEERQVAGCPSTQNWCCASAVNLKIFFIGGAGSKCQSKAFLSEYPENLLIQDLENPLNKACVSPNARPLCCLHKQIVVSLF